MRRVCAVVLLTIAGLIMLVRYHPSPSAPTSTAVHASVPPQADTVAPAPSGIPASSRQKAVDGATVQTDFGPYRVEVLFTGNKITDVQLITEPSDRHSQRIATNAASTLREEALQSQNAKIDTVSGATITSQAYAQSLQAAIDSNGS